MKQFEVFLDRFDTYGGRTVRVNASNKADAIQIANIYLKGNVERVSSCKEL